MRAALAALAVALLPACPRRPPTPGRLPDAAVSTRPVSLDDPRDAAPDAVAAHDAVTDRAAAVVRGPWQRLPFARWTDPARLGRWDDAPDFDGDGAPDEVIALDARLVACEAAHRDAPCPAAGEDDGAGDEGPARVALIARFSADVDTTAGVGRLFGVQRVWRSSALPTSRIEAVRFGDFGRGVSVRTTLLVDHGGSLRDTVDRVDLFLGAGLDRAAGTLVHHCIRSIDGTLRRAGALAVALPVETPTLWRFATAHPFSGCETNAVAFDAALGRTLARGVRVLDLRATGIETHRDVRVAVAEGRASVVERAPRDAGADVGQGDPLALGDVRVVAVARRCDVDVVRYVQQNKSCLVRVERPGSDGRCDPSLAPVAAFDDAHPVALVPAPGSAMPSLVLHRAGAVLAVPLPATCGVGHRAVSAAPYRGPIPVGTPVSTDAGLVLFADGRDLWLARPGDPRPALVNVPGDGLPRGTVRAVAFLDDHQVAVVMARTLYEFSLEVPSPMESVPESLRVGADELARAVR